MILRLDPSTLLVASTLLSATLGLMWLSLVWNDTRVGGVGYWGAANLTLAVAAFLGGSRGEVPDFLSLDIGNSLIFISSGLCWCAARRFDERPAKPGYALLGAVAWLLLRRVPGLLDEVELRVILASFIAGTYILATAWEFSRRWPDMLMFRGVVMLSFTLHGLLIMARIPGMLVLEEWHVTEDLPGSIWLGLAVLEVMVHGVATSFALLAMILEREQRRAVAEIAKSRDAADRANAAKSRFLAHMSHELRTPLNGVLGLAQVLAANHGLPPEARSHGTMIERAGRHLLALVNDVLDLSQVEAGRMRFDSQPVPLGRLLDSAVVLVQQEASRKRIRLFATLATGCPQVVMGDQLRLRQVLLNLAGNAVKFTPEHGEVRVELMAGAAGGLRIEVTDTGPGIPHDQRNRIFHDFGQVQPAEAGRKQEGNGLGLAISAGLVTAMGGRIGMVPGPDGKGSRFWAELPLATGPAPATPTTIHFTTGGRVRAGSHLRILVVDDVGLNRLVARALLESAGHEVVVASSGGEAIAALAEDRFDLVLMDVQMPEMSGLEATRRIRAAKVSRRGGGHLPIVALTGEDTECELRACLDAGMDAHLAKPADRASLLATIDRVTLPAAEPAGRIPVSGLV
jgi:signal transduction histidine kinase/ActR/RegA family two-component response regulator